MVAFFPASREILIVSCLPTHLDITGVGIVELPTFDKQDTLHQLLVNYANDELQQIFNLFSFQWEQETFRVEDSDWTFIDFGMDAARHIGVVANPTMSLRSLMEDESMTTTVLMERLGLLSKTERHLKVDAINKTTFNLCHWKGTVEYDVR